MSRRLVCCLEFVKMQKIPNPILILLHQQYFYEILKCTIRTPSILTEPQSIQLVFSTKNLHFKISGWKDIVIFSVW